MRISLWVGFWDVRRRPLGGFQPGVCPGGALSLTRQAVGVPSHPRLERPAGRGQGSSPPTGGQETEVPAGRVRDGAHGDPGEEKTPRGPWGVPGSLLTGSRGARRRGGSTPAERLPAARPARGRAAGRRAAAGTEGAQGARWAGPPPRLLEPGGGASRTRPGGAGGTP